MRRILTLVAMLLVAILVMSSQTAAAQDIGVEQVPDGPPPTETLEPGEEPRGEPPGFDPEPLPTTAPRYEVLIISGEDEHNVQLANRLRPYSLRTVDQGVRDAAASYAKRWQAAGYRPTILYAPGSVERIRSELIVIASRYAGREAQMRQIAVHYYGHGDRGVILPSPGNRVEPVATADGFTTRTVEARIEHVSIGSAVAAAFPAEKFDLLQVVALLDACRQGGALVDVRDAVLTGRTKGVTSGITISSSTEDGPANTSLVGVGVYGNAFVDSLAGPAFAQIHAAHKAGAAAQLGTPAAPTQARGRAVFDQYLTIGARTR